MTRSDTHSPPTPAPPDFSRRRAGRVALAVGCAAAAWAGWMLVAARLETARVVAMLDSPDAQSRKQAAWRTAERRLAAPLELLRDRLRRAAEPSADVRETYVYALGLGGDPRDFDLLAGLATGDPSGYVRQAAWLAAARVDARRCRAALEAPRAQATGPARSPDFDPPATGEAPRAARAPADAPAEDAWDAIGIAQAWLELRDPRGLTELLHLASGGTADQRAVCARALHRVVKPALESAGLWPAAAAVEPGQSWPAPLLEVVRRRCAETDLPRLLQETGTCEQRSLRVRRNVARLTGFRDRLARILFARW